ncbi:hypothetical protein ABIC78_004245 [Novosphingobium sp. 1529]
MLLLFATDAASPQRSGDTAGTTADARIPELWFSANSPWNIPITSTIKTSYSDAAIAAYAARGHAINMNWGSAGVYVIYDYGTERSHADLAFRDGNGQHWAIPHVPISSTLIKAVTYRLEQGNTDGMTCVVDVPSKRFLSFWQPRKTANGITIRTGGFASFTGLGWSLVGRNLPSLGRAAGSNYCGGLIRESEMQRGTINHALALAWPKDLIRAPTSPFGALQYPASNTDGVNMTSPAAVPMGARIQLNPALDDAALMRLGLTRPADLIIGHALQRYGGYIVDSNTATMGGSVYFESRFNSGGRIYGATNPWPLAILSQLRFVPPPPPQGMDLTSPALLATTGNPRQDQK